MNVNDGTEPCPTCHSGIPHGTIRLHAEINRLRAENEKLRAALAEALDLAEEGWDYASDYFRNKWRSDERVAALRALLPNGNEERVK